MAHLFARRFDAASSWLEQASREAPNVLRIFGFMAAAHALAGRMEEARRAMAHVRRLDPALRIAGLDDWVVLRRPDDFAMLADGLRKAGLPD